MHEPNISKKLNPSGQWNSSRIIHDNNKVEHWLNGKKVLSFVPWSEQWYKKKNSGKCGKPMFFMGFPTIFYLNGGPSRFWGGNFS